MTSPISSVRVMILLGVAMLFFLLLTWSAPAGAELQPGGSRTVQPGDTLWAIAADLTPEGGDVRQSVHTIRRLNRLDTSMLRPGQQLVLPGG